LCTTTNSDTAISERQQELLAALDDLLGDMSGAEHASLWTEDALRACPEWAVVRQMAFEALVAFDWEIAVPPSYGEEFIGGKPGDV
jgi:hypothetical protein